MQRIVVLGVIIEDIHTYIRTKSVFLITLFFSGTGGRSGRRSRGVFPSDNHHIIHNHSTHVYLTVY